MLIFAGCSKSTSPNPVNISGVWSGTGTLTSVKPISHPLAQLIAPSIGSSSASTVSISHIGQSVTLIETSDESGFKTTYDGTFDGHRIIVSETSSDTKVGIGISCPGGIVLDIETIAGSMSGILDENRITGTFAETVQCTYTGTNTPAGVISLSGTFTISKD